MLSFRAVHTWWARKTGGRYGMVRGMKGNLWILSLADVHKVENAPQPGWIPSEPQKYRMHRRAYIKTCGRCAFCGKGIEPEEAHYDNEWRKPECGECRKRSDAKPIKLKSPVDMTL